jgi:hypothetical protein
VTPTKSAGRRRLYSAEVRAGALDLIRAEGIAAAHRGTGIPKSTLSRWAVEAGVRDVPNHEKTAAATAARLRYVEEAKSRLTEILAAVAETGARLELTILDPRHELARPDLPHWVDEDTGEAHPVVGARLDQIVGARTRAIHDLNLLTGQATANAAIVVRLEIPRPDPRASDAAAIAEAELLPPEDEPA